ncbi:hypothetical protein FSP39_015584 [Pinctada imbricata]|uniref:Uncharacterized protein n=1 Tax=Pinctada imbricata TaxID=66713 RepID=A0AA88Y7I5_PINIB|nr:hypothetical protein FSP39_015584 [Pinctada imbricata]
MSSNPASVEIEGATPPGYLPTGFDNLKQEATWLYEDHVKLNKSLKYYQESFAEEEQKAREFKNEILNIKEENRLLKLKLHECSEREVTHRETLKELIAIKEERAILQKRVTEDEKLREYTETQDAEIRTLQAKVREQHRHIDDYQRDLRELKDKLQSTQFIADMESGHRKSLEGNVKKLENKLHILTRSTLQPEDEDATFCKTPERGRFKRHRIDECRRCHTCLPSDTLCTFHAKAPIQVLIKDSNGHISRPDNQKFWPCCGRTGTKEPEGCRSLPEHDLGY